MGGPERGNYEWQTSTRYLSNMTWLLSYCFALPKSLSAPTPGNNNPFVKHFSLSPFPAFINCLCWHTDCLHLISRLLVSHLVRFWAFQSQTWRQPALIQTMSWQPWVMLHPFLFLPERRNFLWELDNFPCSGELLFLMPEKNLSECFTHHISIFQQHLQTGTPASIREHLAAPSMLKLLQSPSSHLSLSGGGTGVEQGSL